MILLMALLCLATAPFSAMLLTAATMAVMTMLAALDGWMKTQPWKTAVAVLTGVAAFSVFVCLFRVGWDYSYLLWRLSPFLNPTSSTDVQFGHGFVYYILRDGNPANVHRSTFLQKNPLEYSLALLVDMYGSGVYLLCVAITALLFIFAVRRIHRLHSTTGKLAACASFIPLFLQGVFYLLDNAGWLPFMSLTLPFLSFSKTINLSNYILAGVLFSVFRHDSIVRDRSYAQFSIRSLWVHTQKDGKLSVKH